ncbi:MAG: prolipoprotein diacylglyceryl transferase [Acidobacteria bacterium]|nr:prolipoprotein diacylglyceryl transferase [Acidobacteriota bacterium]
MLPYVDLAPIHLAGGWIRWPMLCASMGVLVAHFALLARARRLTLDVPTAASMSFFMVIAGLLGARLFKLAYFPGVWSQLSWLDLFAAGGLASFGGLAGGLLGALVYFAARRMGAALALDYLDALAAVFPLGWLFGRLGCAITHDHPGLASSSVFAVAYPDMPRFDLGYIEVLFLALVMIPLFVVLARRPQSRGLFLTVFFLLYGGFRLSLDTLHVDPPRYLGVTVDQWAYGSMLLLGVALAVTLRPFRNLNPLRREVFA